MIGLVKAEATKLTGRKLYPVMVLVLAAFTGLAGFFLLIFGQINTSAAAEGLPVLRKPEAYLLGIQQVVGQTWFPLILAVVVLGGELASTIWATSLTRESRKLQHVTARLLVFTFASWLAMLVGIGLWSGLTALFAEGSGGPDSADWLGIIWKAGFTQVAWVALGLGFISLLRSIGPAIGAVLALSFGEGLLVLWRPYQNVSLTGATTGIFGNVPVPGLGQFFSSTANTTLHSVLIILSWTVVGLALTWWGLIRRDA